MAIFWVDVLIETSVSDTTQIERDISHALSPLGFYPFIKKIEKVRD